MEMEQTETITEGDPLRAGLNREKDDDNNNGNDHDDFADQHHDNNNNGSDSSLSKSPISQPLTSAQSLSSLLPMVSSSSSSNASHSSSRNDGNAVSPSGTVTAHQQNQQQQQPAVIKGGRWQRTKYLLDCSGESIDMKEAIGPASRTSNSSDPSSQVTSPSGGTPSFQQLPPPPPPSSSTLQSQQQHTSTSGTKKDGHHRPRKIFHTKLASSSSLHAPLQSQNAPSAASQQQSSAQQAPQPPQPPPPPRILKQITFKNNDSYDGEWNEDDKMHGRGNYLFANGDAYDGEFFKNAKHGYATCLYKGGTGDIFQGYWVSDKPCMERIAQITYENGDKYVGQVMSGEQVSGGLPKILKNGRGEIHFRDGAMYWGEWKRDVMCGFGIMVYKSNEQYYGNWEDSKRNGYGVMINTDGTIFEGEWKRDQRNGQGTLRLANGTSISGMWKGDLMKQGNCTQHPLAEAPRCSRFAMKDELDRFQESPGQFTVIERKWTVFFSKFSDVIETQKWAFSESSTAKFISEKRLGRGNVSPMSTSSIRNSVRDWIINSVNSISPNALGFIVSEFVEMFQWRYTTKRSVSARALLPHAVDDILSFLNKLYQTVYVVLGGDQIMSLVGAKSVYFLLKESLLRKVYKPLFALYKEINLEKDAMLHNKLSSLSRASLWEIGVRAEFIPLALAQNRSNKNSFASGSLVIGKNDTMASEDRSLLFEPYDSAILELRKISQCSTPLDKTQVLVQTSTEIENHVRVYQLERGQNFDHKRGAEDLFPIFLHVFIRANIPNLISEWRFLVDFMDESVYSTECAYRFSNFEAALQYVRMLDWNIRDERGILVPTSLLEEKLTLSVTKLLREAEQSRREMPKLLWLSSLLISVANSDLFVGKIPIFPTAPTTPSSDPGTPSQQGFDQMKERRIPIGDEFIELAHTNFENANSVLVHAGLRLERVALSQQPPTIDTARSTAPTTMASATAITPISLQPSATPEVDDNESTTPSTSSLITEDSDREEDEESAFDFSSSPMSADIGHHTPIIESQPSAAAPEASPSVLSSNISSNYSSPSTSSQSISPIDSSTMEPLSRASKPNPPTTGNATAPPHSGGSSSALPKLSMPDDEGHSTSSPWTSVRGRDAIRKRHDREEERRQALIQVRKNFSYSLVFERIYPSYVYFTLANALERTLP